MWEFNEECDVWLWEFNIDNCEFNEGASVGINDVNKAKSSNDTIWGVIEYLCVCNKWCEISVSRSKFRDDICGFNKHKWEFNEDEWELIEDIWKINERYEVYRSHVENQQEYVDIQKDLCGFNKNVSGLNEAELGFGWAVQRFKYTVF